jgi:serine/threonine protein phosphatase PrpC
MDERFLRVEYAEVSLCGSREDNQDRAAVAVAPAASLIMVLDGMGGHAHGAAAAESGRKVLLKAFGAPEVPFLDPMGFLHRALGDAHAAVVALGEGLPVDRRPRSTIAACLVQEGTAWFAHLGDSRIYLLRDGEVRRRTRDHSHVELLVREGIISDAQVHSHPLRNYVESCIGGEDLLPEMAIGRCERLRAGDVLLACTDGFWVPLGDDCIATSFRGEAPLPDSLGSLASLAVQRAAATSDNTTAAALRLL